ncbi:MAG: 6-phosphofructokinase [Chloroflexi bacterium RBG_16_57_8]|nr:MAG: 6-phosphofructokinase [Chloroflexi bacterium RBG_16_57_8]
MDKRRIGILTGGGDCPGMNAVIRAVAKKAILDHGFEVIGIEDGYEGLIHNRCRPLTFDDVSGIITLGGTVLGTSNTANPYAYGTRKDGDVVFEDVSPAALATIEKLGIECLVCVGGDGSLTVAERLSSDGVPVVGVPKTIDNDLYGTDVTVGFDAAVSIAAEGIDRIHTTAQSHHRVMIIEVMGRNAGWLALHAGVAGGGDIILIPEIPYDIEAVVERVKQRSRAGKRFTIVVIAEGAKAKGGEVVVKRVVKGSVEPIRLGGISFALSPQLEERTGMESRAVVLGHLLRGGSPTPFDRVLATRMGTKAVDMVIDRQFCHMVGVKGESLINVPLTEVTGRQRKVPPGHPLVQSARSMGTCFGDHT